MAKINFDSAGRSYIEIKKYEGGVSIILSAEDSGNPQNTIVNSVKLTAEQFSQLVSEVMGNS